MSKKRLNTGNVAADNNAGINSDLSESQYASLIEKLIAEDESESFDAIDFSVSATEKINNDFYVLLKDIKQSEPNDNKHRQKNSLIKILKRNFASVLFASVILAVFFTVLFFPESENTVLEETVIDVSVTEVSEEPTLYPEEELYAPLHHEELQKGIEEIAYKNRAVGLQVAVIESGELSDTFCYGWAQLNKVKMTSEHKIRVASVSKVLVGMGAMLLREKGIIDMDESIGNIWETEIVNPYYPDSPVSIRTMLNHTSTIPAYADSYSMYYNSVRNRFDDAFNNVRPGSFEAYYYNNYVFRALGMTLELAADEKLDKILHDNIYNPLDIDAAFAAGDLKNTDMIATLYDENRKVERSASTLSTFHVQDGIAEEGLYFAGGLTISAYDLAKIVCILVNNGTYNDIQFLSEESVDIMESCFSEPLPDGSYQGTPLLYLSEIYGREGIFFHTGSAYGSFNCMSYDPLTGDGVVVLSTGAVDLGDTADMRYICDSINDYIYSAIA